MNPKNSKLSRTMRSGMILLACFWHLFSHAQITGQTASFSSSEMVNGGTKSIVLANCRETNPCYQYDFSSAKLYAQLDLSGDNFVLENQSTFEISVDVELKVNFCRMQGQFPVSDGEKTYVKTLKINQDIAESFIEVDVLADYHRVLDVSMKLVSVTGDAAYMPYAELRFGTYDLAAKRRPSTVQLTSVTTVGTSSMKLKWSDDACGPAYGYDNHQLEILRLYNEDEGIALENDPQHIKSEVDWKKALKIETNSSSQEHIVTLAEGTGYYVWRVRGISNQYPGGSNNPQNWGAWTSVGGFGQDQEVELTTASSPLCFYYTQFDSDKNWTYSRVFSEGDAAHATRTNERMNFATSLLLPTQQQLKISSTDRVMASQQYQDYSQRTKLQTLPVPLPGTNQLGYKSALVRGTDGKVYGPEHYDGASTYNEPAAFSSAAGEAFSYYSDAGEEADVASAEGYPFSSTQYYNDGTSLAKKQGGPGSVHRLKKLGGRENGIYYASVSQDELTRVFGKEAPIASTVHKVINIDANKTVKVSYINKDGEVIATCLSRSDNASPLENLSSVQFAEQFIHESIENNYPSGDRWIASEKKYFAEQTSVDIFYELTSKNITEQMCGMNYCSTCDYQVTVRVYSADDPSVVEFSATEQVTGECAANKTKSITKNALVLDPGYWVFEKVLTAITLDPTTANTSDPKTFLEQHLSAIEQQYRTDLSNNTTFQNQLSLLAQNKVEEFYETFSPAGYENAEFVTYKVEINSSYCIEIQLPVLLCEEFVCSSSNMGGEMWDYFRASLEAQDPDAYDTPAKVFAELKYRYKPDGNVENSGIYTYLATDFNPLFANLLSDYSQEHGDAACEQLTNLWRATCDAHVIERDQSEASKTDPRFEGGYEYNFMNSFFNKLSFANGYAGYSTSTSQYLLKGYQYLFYDDAIGANRPDCEGTFYDYVEEQMGVSNPPTDFSSLFALGDKTIRLAFRECLLTDPADGLTGAAAEAKLNEIKGKQEASCRRACLDREKEFEYALVDHYHGLGLSVEGFIDDSSVDWIVEGGSGASSSYDIDRESLECAVFSAVRTCRSKCKLTLVKEGDEFKSIGTPEEIELINRITAGELSVKQTVTAAEEASGDWFEVSDAVYDHMQEVWTNFYDDDDADDDMNAVIPTKDGGYLLVGTDRSYRIDNPYDPSEQPQLSSDLCIIKVDSEGEQVWKKLLGGTNKEMGFTAIELENGDFIVGGRCDSQKGSGDVQTDPGANLSGGGPNLAYRGWVVRVSGVDGTLQTSIRPSFFVRKLKLLNTGEVLAIGEGMTGTVKNGIFAYGSLYMKYDQNLEPIWAAPLEDWNANSDRHLYKSLSADITLGNTEIFEVPVAGGGHQIVILGKTNVAAGDNQGPTTTSRTDKSTPKIGAMDIWGVVMDYDGNVLHQYGLGEASKEFANIQTLPIAGTEEEILMSYNVFFWDDSEGYDYSDYDEDYISFESSKIVRMNLLTGQVTQSLVPNIDHFTGPTNGFPNTTQSMGISDLLMSPTGMHYFHNYSFNEEKVYIVAFKSDLTGYIPVIPIGEPVGTWQHYKYDDPYELNLVPHGERDKPFYSAQNSSGDFYLFTSQGEGSTVGAQGEHPHRYGDRGRFKGARLKLPCSHNSFWINFAPEDTFIDDNTDHADEITIRTCSELNSEALVDAILGGVEAFISKMKTDYEEGYKSQCLDFESLSETFTLDYSQGYYHYMLYYYDRAGRLIKTVPPAGVDLMDKADHSPAYDGYEKVVLNANELPFHTMVTDYEYNSQGQVVRKHSPDGGETTFIYDDLGRLRFSQNADQKGRGAYSYTKYDALGRIIEVGESTLTPSLLSIGRKDADFPSQQNTFVIRTVYGIQAADIAYAQGNISNRISHVIYDEDGTLLTKEDQAVTYYSYDPQGNVKWLVQRVPGLTDKRIDYAYDLISNKVLEVAYNKGREDQFFHRYSYDEDNRLVGVETSEDNIIWSKDADYEYYLHGSLKRGEVGHYGVQGVDYAYTVQGWLKAINSGDLTDNVGGDLTKTTGDVFGMMLHYFDGDYKRSGSAFANDNIDDMNLVRSLYNGNVTAWNFMTLDPTGTADFSEQRVGFQYKYDQLNRILNADFHAKDAQGWGQKNDYQTAYTYDANGNINTLTRFGNTSEWSPAMDNLSYDYSINDISLSSNEDYFKINNQLKSVTEGMLVTPYAEDIEGFHSYTYDDIGRLIKNEADDIFNIEWSPDSKILKVERMPNSSQPDLYFSYDAMGYRIRKREVYKEEGVRIKMTYYVRDAQGNVMSTYVREEETVDGERPWTLALREQMIYGSERLGLVKRDVLMDEGKMLLDGSGHLGVDKNYGAIAVRTTDNVLLNAQVNSVESLPSNQLFEVGPAPAAPGTTALTASGVYVGVPGRTFTIEDASGSVILKGTTYKEYLGQTNVLLLHDANGNLFHDRLLMANADADIMGIRVPETTDEYYILTSSPEGFPLYHRVKLGATGDERIVVEEEAFDLSDFGFSTAWAAVCDERGVFGTRLFTVRNTDEGSELIEYPVYEHGIGEAQVLQTYGTYTDKAIIKVSAQLDKLAVLAHQSTLVQAGAWFDFPLKARSNALYVYDYNLGNIDGPQENHVVDLGINHKINGMDFSETGAYLYYSVLDDQNGKIKRLNTSTHAEETVYNYGGSLLRGTGDKLLFLSSAPLDQDKVMAIEQAEDVTVAVTIKHNLNQSGTIAGFDAGAKQISAQIQVKPIIINAPPKEEAELFERLANKRRFEFTDHRGNVRVTYTDQKEKQADGTLIANVVNTNDYYPFGMQMPGRSHVAPDEEYRFGFGGHEADHELKGRNNFLLFGGYGYDVRLGRRFGLDPIEQAGTSGYVVFNNNPIYFLDPDGESPISIFAKMAAKAGLKKAAKTFVQNQIKKRLKAYLGKQGARKWASQLADDALTFIDHATKTSWWEVIVEVIPVVGDAYGAAQLGKQGYALWKGLEKFEKIAELGDRAAKGAWKVLGSNANLVGKGADDLKNWIKKVNKDYGKKLNDNTIAGSIKEKFGLHSGFKPDGTPFKHLTSYENRMAGLKKQIESLEKQIKDNVFEGDTLKAAEGVLKNVKNQYQTINNIMKSAEKAATKMGKVY